MKQFPSLALFCVALLAPRIHGMLTPKAGTPRADTPRPSRTYYANRSVFTFNNKPELSDGEESDQENKYGACDKYEVDVQTLAGFQAAQESDAGKNDPDMPTLKEASARLPWLATPEQEIENLANDKESGPDSGDESGDSDGYSTEVDVDLYLHRQNQEKEDKKKEEAKIRNQQNQESNQRAIDFLKKEIAKILPLNPDPQLIPASTDSGLFLAIFCVIPYYVAIFNRIDDQAVLTERNARGQTPLEYARQRAQHFAKPTDLLGAQELLADCTDIIQLLEAQEKALEKNEDYTQV
jgi:hypothetical protein